MKIKFSLVLVFILAFLNLGLTVGDSVGSVMVRDQNRNEIKLDQYKGKWLLLYFYPKDDTPGCTREACKLRDDFTKFKAAGVVVYGVSTQSFESHKKFKEKHRLPFDLIVDEDGKLGSLMGISKIPLVGIYKRQSVLIDPTGHYYKKFESVDPDKHSEEVLDVVVAAGGLK